MTTQRVLSYVGAARRRERPAHHLARRREWVAALRLQLDAASLLMRAKLASASESPSLDELPASDLLTLLHERLHAEGLSEPAELARLGPLLSAPDWDALDRLSDDDGERASNELALALRFLAGTIPLIARTERRRELRVFVAGMALIVMAALGALVWRLTRPPNLALHRPASSTAPGFNTSAEEAVNGARFGELGYHSANADSPWLQVDLTEQHRIRRIQVYGRGDCCFGQSIPLLVESSSDGQSYVALGQRDEPFQPFVPWVLAPKGVSARYVRVRPVEQAPLVIAELEVY